MEEWLKHITENEGGCGRDGHLVCFVVVVVFVLVHHPQTSSHQSAQKKFTGATEEHIDAAATWGAMIAGLASSGSHRCKDKHKRGNMVSTFCDTCLPVQTI